MANPRFQSAWRYKGAWDGIAVAGTIGCDRDEKIRISPAGLFGAAMIIAKPNDDGLLASAMSAAYGIMLPPPRRFASHSAFDLIWAGPNRWLALSSDFMIASTLSTAVGGHAAISDRSGSLAMLAISGKKARDMFAKGLAVDLHPRKFKPGDAALSSIAHVDVHLWQTNEAPSYKLVVPRSMAASFWEWLIHAGSEFGLRV